MPTISSGGCLCGGVRYRIDGPLRDVIACHCTQCRKQSGHYFAATNAPDENLHVEDSQELLRWFDSSPQARRAFCGRCGSTLFWKHQKDPFTSVAAGSLDAPTGLRLRRHIFCADKGDYYDIDGDLPTSPGS